jgi:hypothetical protein
LALGVSALRAFLFLFGIGYHRALVSRLFFFFLKLRKETGYPREGNVTVGLTKGGVIRRVDYAAGIVIKQYPQEFELLFPQG